MRASRLTTALAGALPPLPGNGRVAVFHPPAGQDISALPCERVQIIHGIFPEHRAWAGRGYDTVVREQGRYAAAVVFLPRAGALARALVARAAAATGGGPVIIDGQKTDGVDSLLKACRRAGATVEGVVSRAHGRTFAISGGEFSAWSGPEETRIEGEFVTAPGVFSADGVDPGSALLAEALPPLSGRLCDLGAGWGWLAHRILGSEQPDECHLVEIDHAALECARRNITDWRARFHWIDAESFAAREAGGFDHVVTNPPFHLGRVADPGIGRGFIRAAARLLKRRGVLWLVANRHLPYERELDAAFREVSQLAGSASFKLFRARAPRPVQR